jgi:hypothetical protein
VNFVRSDSGHLILLKPHTVALDTNWSGWRSKVSVGESIIQGICHFSGSKSRGRIFHRLRDRPLADLIHVVIEEVFIRLEILGWFLIESAVAASAGRIGIARSNRIWADFLNQNLCLFQWDALSQSFSSTARPSDILPLQEDPDSTKA